MSRSNNAALPDVTADKEKSAKAEKFMTPEKIEDKEKKSVLKRLRCPISKLIFADPVITDVKEEGSLDIYEREEILKWMEDNDKKQHKDFQTLSESKDQTEGEHSEESSIRELVELKEKVSNFLDKNPKNSKFRNSDQLYLPRSWIKQLEQACQQADVKEIERLCNKDPRLFTWTFDFKEGAYQQEGKTIWRLTCENGKLESVKKLIEMAEKRAEGLALLLLLKPDNTGQTSLHYALKSGRDSELVRFLAAKMGRHAEKILQPDREETLEELLEESPGYQDPGEKVEQKESSKGPLLLQMKKMKHELQELKKLVKAQEKMIKDQQDLIQQLRIRPVVPSGFLRPDRLEPMHFYYPEEIPLNLAEFRQRVIEDLPFYPQAREVSAYLQRDIKESKESKEIKFVGHKGKIDALTLFKAKDDKEKLASISQKESAIRIWDVSTQLCEAVFEEKRFSSTVLPPVFFQSMNLLLIAVNAYIKVYSMEEKEFQGQVSHEEIKDAISAFIVSSHHTITIMAAYNNDLYIWRHNESDGITFYRKIEHTSQITALAVQGSGYLNTWALIGYGNGNIRIFNFDALSQLGVRLQGHSNAVRALVALPGGQRFASGSDDSTIKIWNIRNNSCEITLAGTGSPISRLKYLPAVKRLIAVSWEDLYIVDINNVKLVYQGQVGNGDVIILADGRILKNEDNNIEVLPEIHLSMDNFMALDLNFRQPLIQAGARVTKDEKNLTVVTAKPTKAALNGLSAALKTAYSDSALAPAISEDKARLTIPVKNQAQRDELESLCDVFGAKPAVSPLRGAGMFGAAPAARRLPISASAATLGFGGKQP